MHPQRCPVFIPGASFNNRYKKGADFFPKSAPFHYVKYVIMKSIVTLLRYCCRSHSQSFCTTHHGIAAGPEIHTAERSFP